MIFPKTQAEIQKDFNAKYSSFLELFSHLEETVKLAVNKVKTLQSENDYVVFFMFFEVLEDFNSVVLLCQNGLSRNAMKVLRSLFEHSVTLAYLYQNQDEISLFADWHNINQHKLFDSFERGFPQSLQDTDFLREKEEIKENYNSVKMLFRDTKKEVCDECKTKVCDKCAKEKMRHSWSKRSIIEMASRSGISAKTSYFAYAIPLLESHPSIHSIANRITFIEDTFEYRQIANPKNEIQTLLHAHYLLLHSLGVFADYFLLNEDEEFSDKAKIEGKSFTKVWNSFRM